MPSYPRVNILGVKVSVINMNQAIDQILTWICERNPAYVCLAPAHAIMDCYQQPGLRNIYAKSGLTTPDGMSIVWLLKLHGYPHVNRVYGPDLLQEVCKTSKSFPIRHYFYGGGPGVTDELVDRLKSKFPWLEVAGTCSPPFRELTTEEDIKVIRQIKSAKPDIVWVGLGSPRQEIWMASHVNKLDVPVMIGVGAAFDFLSGKKPQAPVWMQKIGLEWFYRLLTEPKRLWRRYIQYPKFVILVLLQSLGLLQFKEDDQ